MCFSVVHVTFEEKSFNRKNYTIPYQNVSMSTGKKVTSDYLAHAIGAQFELLCVGITLIKHSKIMCGNRGPSTQALTKG